jgi:hypothetical protein
MIRAPGHAERVAERDRAAERVELLGVDAPLVAARHDLGGERLVELEHVDVVDRHAGLREHLLDGGDRAEAHDLRADRGHGGGDDAGARLEPEGLRALVGHHEHRGGAVVERAGVAGRDRAVGPERGLELGELLHRRARAGAVVAPHLGAVGCRDRDDLGVEVAAVARRHGAVLRDHGPLVLRLAADLAALRNVLGGHAHRDVDVEQRALGAVELGVELPRVLGGEARDRLDAGGDVLVALAGLDRVEGHADRLQRRGAEAVDGRRRDVMVDPREQLGVAPDVHPLLAGLEAAAHHDVVRLREVDLGVAVHERLERHRGEVVRADVLEGSLDRAPDRRADGVDDHGFRHLGSSLD